MKYLRASTGRLIAFSALFVLPLLVTGATLDLKSGATFDFFITGGDAPYRPSGNYRFAIFDAGTSYRIFNVQDTIDSSGTMLYSHINESVDQIEYNDSIDGTGFLQELDFSNETQGSYTLSNRRFSGTQTGTFVVYEGTAPVTFSRKLLTLTVTDGSAPFTTSGTQRFIATTANAYVLERNAGTVNSSGTFSYVRINRSSSQIFFNDSLRGSGFNLLTFSTDRAGIFLIRGDGGGFQTGTFTLTEFVPVSITAHPVSRTVLLGNPVSFQATVAGTGPLFYQWQKNGAPIPGATTTQYTIPFVQSSDAGNYRLVARNAAGSVTSANATLTPVCNYVLSPTMGSFNDNGGEGSIIVSGASGECVWTVTNQNSWITITSSDTGTGVGSITYTVEPNPTDVARLGYLIIGPKSFAVKQSARRAPPLLAGKTAQLNPNGGGTATRLTFTHSNFYQWDSASNETPPTDKGGYTYSRSESENHLSAITYSESEETRELSLSFESHTTGFFTLRNQSDLLAEGTFVLSATEPDFNFDTQSDFLFQNSNGVIASWFMQGTDFLGSGSLRNGIPAAFGWRAVGAADFNNDGKTDVVFQHNDGNLAVWYLDRVNFLGAASIHNGTKVATGWRAIDVTDFNHDGNPDIVFQHESRRVMVWNLDGVFFLGAQLIRNGVGASPGWQVVGTADFNQDGQTDILWRHSDRRLAIWHLVGTTFVDAATIPSPAAGWWATGISDFNFDGQSDLLFRHADGRLAFWLMEKNARLSSGIVRNGVRVPPSWAFIAPR